MERQIPETTAGLVTAVACGDAAAAGAVYADDAKLLAPGAELLQGRADIEAYWRAGIGLGVSAVKFERQVLEAVGGTVVEIGRYAVSVQAERGEPAIERGKYVVVHTEQADGSWRRAVDVFNPDEPRTARRTHQKEESW